MNKIFCASVILSVLMISEQIMGQLAQTWNNTSTTLAQKSHPNRFLSLHILIRPPHNNLLDVSGIYLYKQGLFIRLIRASS
jgi:hypothetical protein